MNCHKAGDLLSAYIDGELAGRHTQALETHLTACAGCREELETLRSAIALLEAPMTPARPEGLLEEFKAQYLPRAEAASAPRWGFRLPVMPKIEWPSMGSVLVPMGGMAAAAAALFVVLHNQPAVIQPPATRTQVASSAGPATEVAAAKVAETPALEDRSSRVDAENVEAVLGTPPAARKQEAPARPPKPVAARSERRRSRAQTVKAAPAAPRRARRSAPVLAEAPRSERRNTPRRSGTLYAKQVVPAATASDKALLEVLRSHEPGVPTEESLWADQVVVIHRKAATAVVDDSFAQVTCTNVKTGEVKSVTFGAPVAPAPPAGPEPGAISDSPDQ
jgi:hypothetical protein